MPSILGIGSIRLVVLLLVYPAAALECLTGSYGCADQEKVELLQVHLNSVKGSERLGKVSSTVPSFEINLAKEPEERWVVVARAYKEGLLELQRKLKPKIQALYMEIEDLDNIVEQIFAREAYRQYDRELKGIANVVNEEQMTVEWLRLLNLLPEVGIGLACTGVVVAKADGTMLQGRNMDWGGRDADDLRDLTFEAKYLGKNGGIVFKTTQWPGEVGVRTALRFDGGWAIQQNERHDGNKITVQKRIRGTRQVSSLFLRSAMEQYNSYDEALFAMRHQRFMKPMYLIMSGAGKFQGAVLTVDGRDNTKIRKITQSAYFAGAFFKPKSWFLVQGNKDSLGKYMRDRFGNKIGSKLPNFADRKRDKGEAVLEKVGQKKVSKDLMMQLMQAWPLLQADTVFSTVMVPSQNYYLTDSLKGKVVRLKQLQDRQQQAQ